MNKLLKKYISQLVEQDQKFRKNLVREELGSYLVYLVDSVHNQLIHRILDQHDYPTQRLIGRQGMKDFWLLVQHQDLDIKLQEGCLANSDFEPREKALLTDRVLINKGEKQIYGTQFYRNSTGKLIPRPIKKISQLEKVRKSVGLIPFRDYKKQMKKIGLKTNQLKKTK